eukprot:403345649
MRTLPEPEFAYGHPIPKETDGVGKLTSIWSLHQRSMKGLPDKDFKTLNKASIYNKAVTCQTQYNFRQNVDIRLKEPRRQGPMYLPQEEFTYGRQNRPSTPIKAVVSGFYGDVAEQQILTRYDILKEQAKPISLAQARNHTRGSQMFSDHLRQTARDEQFRQSKTLFKMKKFQNATPRTNSHNNGGLNGLRRTGSQAVFGANNKQI